MEGTMELHKQDGL